MVLSFNTRNTLSGIHDPRLSEALAEHAEFDTADNSISGRLVNPLDYADGRTYEVRTAGEGAHWPLYWYADHTWHRAYDTHLFARVTADLNALVSA